MLKTFKIVGWLEGLSFLLLLLVAMPMKYIAGNPAIVKALGPVHGFLFIAYILLVQFVGQELNWSTRKKVIAAISSVLPAGTFWFERKYLKEENTAI